MSKYRPIELIPLGLAVLMTLAEPASAQRLPLPPHEQEAVNKAVDRGVQYLKRTQQKKGTWAKPTENHQVGYAVLPALTLLECGVSAKDPLVQKTAVFLRSRAAQLNTTYELSLGILFLDRLGEAKDKKIIQSFALRLIAGQSMTGGWGYKCPILAAPVQMDLLTALRHLDPPQKDMPLLADNRPAQPGLAGGGGKKPGDLTPIAQAPGASSLGDGISRSGSSLGESSAPTNSNNDKSIEKDPKPRTDKELPPPPPKPDAKDGKTPAKPARPKPDKPYVVPERLLILPVIQNPKLHVLQDPEDKSEDLILTTTDNSNTQFAILALWTAQRHDVPMKRTLNLVVRRFVTSQNDDGSWGYHYFFGGGDAERPAMTCVGLIGLAVAHGLAQPGVAGRRVQDPRIVNGLIALNKNVGTPVEELFKQPMQNLYFFWSVERVAVLYNLPKIGDKDWYRWGAQVLITNQEQPGNWTGGQYHGNSPVLDTCLALLFLKRANLVEDLTAKLPFQAGDLNDSILQTGKPMEKKPEPPKMPSSAEELSKKEPENLPAKPALADTTQAHLEGTPANVGGKWKWIVASLLVFVVFAGGSLYLLFAARRNDEGAKRDGAKGARKKRRLQSTASGTDDAVALPTGNDG